MDNTLELILRIKDEASETLKKIQNSLASFSGKLEDTSRGSKETSFRIDNLTESFIKSRIAVDLGYKALETFNKGLAFIKDAGFAASRIQELNLALKVMAKANKLSYEEVMNTVLALQKLGISQEEARRSTALLIQSNIDLKNATKLARTAQDLAVVGAMGSSEAFSTLAQAIASQQPILLRQFGITKTLDQIYKDYTNSVGNLTNKKRGLSTELTETQKKMAFLNTILEQGKVVTGVYEESMKSASKVMRSIATRTIPDLKVNLGLLFEPFIRTITLVIYKYLNNLNKVLYQNREALQVVGEVINNTIVKGFLALANVLEQNKNIIIALMAMFLPFFTILAGKLLILAIGSFIALAGTIASAIGVVGLLAGVFVYLGLIIYQNREIILNFISSVFGGLIAFANNIITVISNAFNMIYTTIFVSLNNIANIFFNTFNFIYGIVSYILNNLIVLIQYVFLLIFTVIYNTLYSLYLGVIEPIFNSIYQVINSILTLILSNIVIPVFNSIKNFINVILSTILSIITNILNTIKNIFSNSFNLIYQTIVNIFNQAYNWFTGKLNNLLNFVRDKTNAIVSAFRTMASGIMNALKSIKFPRLSIGEGTITIMGREIKYPKLNVDWYEKGGWVRNTGLAMLHQGEYVLSKDMLRGREYPEVGLGNTINNYIYATVNSELDIDYLIYKLGRELNKL